jgi:hypothetical protein
MPGIDLMLNADRSFMFRQLTCVARIPKNPAKNFFNSHTTTCFFGHDCDIFLINEEHFGDSIKTNWRCQEILQIVLVASNVSETGPGFRHTARSNMFELLKSKKANPAKLEQFEIRSTRQNFFDRADPGQMPGRCAPHWCPLEPSNCFEAFTKT